MLTGLVGGSYRYGVCPNTNSSFAPVDQVPLYAAASGEFPAGFEVGIVGPPNSRQVLARIVLAAEGSFPNPQSHQNVTLTATADSR